MSHKIIRSAIKDKCFNTHVQYEHFLITWLGFLLHEILHQCGVAWRQPVGCTGQMGWKPIQLVAALTLFWLGNYCIYPSFLLCSHISVFS